MFSCDTRSDSSAIAVSTSTIRRIVLCSLRRSSVHLRFMVIVRLSLKLMRGSRNLIGRESKRQSRWQESKLVVIDKWINACLGDEELEDGSAAGGYGIGLHSGCIGLALIYAIQNAADNVGRRNAGSDIHKVHAHEFSGIHTYCVVIEPSIEH